MLEQLKPVAKAVASAVVVAAAYLVGVIPAEGGFGDVSTVQWLGLVVFMGGAYGITYAVPNRPAARRTNRGLPRNETGAVSVTDAVLIALLVLLVLVVVGVLG